MTPSSRSDLQQIDREAAIAPANVPLPGASTGAGQDANVGLTPAKGGAPLQTGTAGGDGAAGLSAAQAGAASPQTSGAGGGGRGLGRIALHWQQTSYPAPTPKTSGLVSTGSGPIASGLLFFRPPPLKGR